MADFDNSDWIWPDTGQGRQPTGPWEIDYAAAITQGLRVVWEDGEVKGVCNAPMPLGSRVVLPGGAAAQCSGTSQARFPTGSFPTADANVPFGTKIFWVKMAANNTTIRSVIGGGNGTLGIRFNSGGTVSLLAVNVQVYATTGVLGAANELLCVALSGTGKLSTIGVYKNGVLSQTLSATSITTAALGNNVYLGSSGAPSNYFDGAILRYMDFDRVLSDKEIKSLYDNPQQIRRSPFPAGLYAPMTDSGASSPSASMAITTDDAVINAAASVRPLATTSVITDNSVVSSSASVSPTASASILSAVSAFSSTAVSLPVASLSATTDSSSISASATVSPVATSVLTTVSAVFAGIAGTGASASAALLTDDSIAVSSASVKAIFSGSITTELANFSGFAGVGSTISGAISTADSVLSATAFVSPIAIAGLNTSASLFTGIAGAGATVSGAVTTDASWMAAVARVSPVALMAEYTDSAVFNSSASSGTTTAIWPTPEQVLLGVTYGPTGVEYIGTLVPGTGSTVYIEQILSEVVDGQIIVLLQDEVIQSNILSETT